MGSGGEIMSTYYYLRCNDCDRELQIGQGGVVHKTYIYKTPEYLEQMENFLLTHETHNIQFCSEYYLPRNREEGLWSLYPNEMVLSNP